MQKSKQLACQISRIMFNVNKCIKYVANSKRKCAASSTKAPENYSCKRRLEIKYGHYGVSEMHFFQIKISATQYVPLQGIY